MDIIEFANSEITTKSVAKFYGIREKYTPPEVVEEMVHVQEKLLKALDAFVNGHENEELHYFYNLMKHNTWYEPMDWSNFKKGLIEHRHPPADLLTGGESRFAILVAWALREEIQKLKKCDHCGKFFLGQKADIRTRYCPECSLKKPKIKEWRIEYMKKYRKEIKHRDRERDRGDEIKRLMKELDIPEEEAEELIKADAEL
jgi:hypothetical protein